MTEEFQTLEKADIMIRGDMKHNLSKISKAKEIIENHKKKKQSLVEENIKNEKDLPHRDKEYKDLVASRGETEQSFERMEMQVRENTEKLRRQKEELEG